MKLAEPARIHLLPAQASPCVLVIRRKPSKCFHIIRWNTKSDKLEHGSWFHGKLYPKRCDISFDGQWMIYLAMGASGNTWNGICRLPYLRTLAEGANMGTWFGGGYWHDRQTLLLNQWQPTQGSVPFKLAQLQPKFGGEDLSVLYAKWERDGWQRRGNNYGTTRRIENPSKYMIACDGDDAWQNRPSRKHPPLIAQYVGYLEHGYTFRFSLDRFENLLDNQVDSACWDSLGNLVYSRQGILYKYSLSDLKNRCPRIIYDLEALTQVGKLRLKHYKA
jgi:hypothetical protein